MDNKRIDYLDGLKGLSALLVFLYHLSIIAFYKGFVGFGTPYASDPALAKEVISSNFAEAVFTNNSFGLYLFFVMIALFPILSYRKHQCDALVMGKAAFKRYFQLLAPCFAAGLINVILYWNGLSFFTRLAGKVNCEWLNHTDPIGCDSLPAFLKTTLVSIWFGPESTPLSPMWCMSIIFFGSLAVYAAYALFGKSKYKYLPCLALVVVSAFYPAMTYFAVGSFLAEYLILNPDRKTPKALSLLLLVIGIVLVKLPVQIYPITLKTEYMCGLGAGLVIWGISQSGILKKILSGKYLVFLGKISFEIILVHFILMSNIGCLIYEWIMNYTASPYIITALCFILLLPFTVLFAKLLNAFISTPVNKLLKKVVDRIF